MQEGKSRGTHKVHDLCNEAVVTAGASLEEDVSGLQVEVHDIIPVEVDHGLGNVEANLKGSRVVETAVLILQPSYVQERSQAALIAVLEDEEELIRGDRVGVLRGIVADNRRPAVDISRDNGAPISPTHDDNAPIEIVRLVFNRLDPVGVRLDQVRVTHGTRDGHLW